MVLEGSTRRRSVARFAFAAIVAVAVIVGPGRSVSACSCAPLSETEAREDSDAVFVGQVIEVDDDLEFEEPFLVRYTIDVERVFTGEAFETQSLVTPQRGGGCGLSMQPGDVWLLYATRPGTDDDEVIDDTELASSLCSASRPADLDAVPSELGDGSNPVSGASEFSGDDDGGGIPGLVFALAFVVFGVGIAAAGTLVATRRRYRSIPDN